MTDSLSLKVEEIVTEIDMSNETRPWLIVEGPSDETFFSTRHLPNNPKSVAALGWENVIGVIAKVLEENITDAILGFIDRDYREELESNDYPEKIVITDYRDLEISMFESGALHKILAELGARNKLPSLDCGNIDILTVKQKVYQVASKMGALRYYSLKEGLNFKLKDLNFTKFISKNTLEINIEKLVNHINSKSIAKITMDDIDAAFKLNFTGKLDDEKYLCCGHDVIELLGVALRKIWGSNNLVKKETLESNFRIGYSDHEFGQSNMCKQLTKMLNQI